MSGTQSVLYVEDEPLLRELASIILSDAGFRVVTAETGEAAIEALDEDGQPFCAVVTDVNLGRGPDGWAVARRARELSRGLPVVYVTGASGHQWISEAVPESLILRKPFTSEQILKALKSLLGNSVRNCSVE
jgi:two-component system, OmpR family, response regulator